MACSACIIQRKRLHCGTCQQENARNYLSPQDISPFASISFTDLDFMLGNMVVVHTKTNEMEEKKAGRILPII
ncbi:hypothetical protein L1049_010703 [Liquidambar formosana]|uniref:Uncharacterized protein n=1 Tax=Liquidambar formosana TaxID=63359 RepID=A0AAP0R4I3_LIQFO